MERYLYKNRVEKLVEKIKKVESKTNKMLFIPMIVAIIVFGILFLLKASFIPYIITIGFCFLLCVFLLIVKVVKKGKIISLEVGNFLCDVINNELGFSAKNITNKNELYKEKIPKTRIASLSEGKTIKMATSFEDENLLGDIYLLTISRQTGNSSVTVLDGLMVSINNINSNNLDLQLRTDRFSNYSLKLSKKLSTDEYRIYFPKDKFDELEKDVAIDSVFNKFNYLKENFDYKQISIDFQEKLTSFSIYEKKPFSIYKKIDHEAIYNLCEYYLDLLEKIKAFSEI